MNHYPTQHEGEETKNLFRPFKNPWKTPYHFEYGIGRFLKNQETLRIMV